MQGLTRTTDYKIQRLSELLELQNGEEYFNSIVKAFVSLNEDVEYFLKEKAVQATKLKTATTYLVYVQCADLEIDLVGYFSLAMKMLTFKKVALSKTSQKVISRFGCYDDDSTSYVIPAVLVAQFGRNFNEASESLSGADLMTITLNQVKNALSFLSGRTVFLESEKKHKLITFYTQHGFTVLDNEVLSKNEKELMQLYKIW